MATTLRVLPWLYRSKLNEKEKAPIYLRISKGNQRVEIATGYFIKLSEWNTFIILSHQYAHSQFKILPTF